MEHEPIKQETEIVPEERSERSLPPHVGRQRWWGFSSSLWSYVTRMIAGPFVMSLVVIMFVFLLQFLMRFIDRLVGRGLGLWTIIQLIAYNLSWMVVLAVPMSVLVACVMGFGAMAAANELTAMKAAGMSLGRMLFPVLVLGILLAVFDLQFNNLILPDANHAAKDLMSDIQRKKPTFAVEPGQFSDEDALPGYTILSRKVVPNTNDLENVTIYDHSQPAEARVLTAKHAHVAFTQDFRNMVLTLYDGEMHEFFTQQPAEYRRGTFGTYVVQIPTHGFDFMRQGESERSDRELSAKDLLRYVYAKDTALAHAQQLAKEHVKNFVHIASLNRPIYATNARDEMPMLRSEFQGMILLLENDGEALTQIDDDIDSYMVEVHKKYAIPVACIIFVLIGAPLGALARRSGVGAGVGLSIGFFMLYWIFLIGGEKLADRDIITPFWGMWGGNLVLLLTGAYLTYRAAVEAPKLGLAYWFTTVKTKVFRGSAQSAP